jgi:hypothetical protein
MCEHHTHFLPSFLINLSLAHQDQSPSHTVLVPALRFILFTQNEISSYVLIFQYTATVAASIPILSI